MPRFVRLLTFGRRSWPTLLVLLAALASLGAIAVGVSGGPELVLERPTVEVPSPPPEPQEADSLETPEPDRWRRPAKRCRRAGGRRYCDGPRRVPKPHGEAAARAERLGLGTRTTANRLLTGPPLPRWVDAASGAARETLQWPVEGSPLGRGFGYIRPALPDVRHDGVDVAATPGTPVRAVNDGIVAYSDNGVHGFGNLVLIVHPGGTVSLYAHLRAAYLFAGQRVRRGQIIGEVGNTGLSQGPHLHFELRRRGRPRDPVRRFVGRPRETS